jgi:hypothetical protein
MLTTVVLTINMGDEIIITGSLPYILDELAVYSAVSVLTILVSVKTSYMIAFLIRVRWSTNVPRE